MASAFKNKDTIEILFLMKLFFFFDAQEVMNNIRKQKTWSLYNLLQIQLSVKLPLNSIYKEFYQFSTWYGGFNFTAQSENWLLYTPEDFFPFIQIGFLKFVIFQ